MKTVKSKIIKYFWGTMVVFFIIYSPAMAQKAGKSDKKQSVKKEYRTPKAQKGPAETNKQARTEIKGSQEMEMKKIKAVETAKENVNQGNLKPKFKKVAKRKEKTVKKKPIQ